MRSNQASQEKIGLIKLIFDTYNIPPKEDVFQIWCLLVERYSPQEVKRGVVKLLEEHVGWAHPPVPGQLVAAIKEAVENDPPPSYEESVNNMALAAWITLCEEKKEIGFSGMPTLSPFTLRVIDSLGGWGVICSTDAEHFSFLKKEFIDTFRFLGQEEVRKSRPQDFPKQASGELLPVSDKEILEVLSCPDETTGLCLLDIVPEKKALPPQRTIEDIQEENRIEKLTAKICKELREDLQIRLQVPLNKLATLFEQRPLGKEPRLEEVMLVFLGTDFDKQRLETAITRAIIRTGGLFKLEDNKVSRFFAMQELSKHIHNLLFEEERKFRCAQEGIPDNLSSAV